MNQISNTLRYQRNILLVLISIFIIGCASKIPAPVKDKITKPITKPIICPDVYTVKEGETLFSISIKCGFNYEKVALANGLEKPYFVKKGDQIRFDILRQKDIQPTQQPHKKIEIETMPFEKGEIIEDSQIITEFTFGDPIKISQPKAMREVYSKKSIKRAKQLISKKDKISKEWGWPTNTNPENSFNALSDKKGIEFFGVPGQEIRSIAKGRIIYVGEELKGYGRLIIIKHSNNILSVYGHQQTLLVKEGQNVVAGQTIGTMGSSGTDMVKLHFEIRKNGKAIDPFKFLKKLTSSN